MSKDHTPGPWTRKEPKDKHNIVANVRGIRVFGPYYASSCADDARLIAAAPDLLAACLGILECLEHGDKWTPAVRKTAGETLRKTITKAIGEFENPANS